MPVFPAIAYGIWYSYSVILVALLAEFGWSRSVLAGAFSVFTLVHGGVNPLVGALCARFRPEFLNRVDSIIFFRRADVIVTGDIIDLRRFPVIDAAGGGSIQGELDALNALLELAIPAMPLIYKEGRTFLVPGHGRIADHAEVVEYRDMVTVVRDRIQSMIDKGLTLDQVKAANPTQGYRARYGSDTGPWTTDMFVEAVYKGLTPSRTF